MRIESELCHFSENKTIVKVNGWINDKNVGSALAEGQTVEEAEDRAISRLDKRIKGVINNQAEIKSINEDKIKNKNKVELPNSQKIENVSIKQEPSDWSFELTSIDIEIKRLNWSREDENIFLEKTLGFNNRNKITKYSDIVKYLSLLKDTENKNLSRTIYKTINTLIEESDVILSDLSWNHVQGRDYLQKEFNVSTRKELNEEQLISFVNKLKSIRNKNLLTNPSQKGE
tara:strand:- start:29 stop:718 length:690 start_codon:yes stop_codon:yes gene_type:complete